MARIVKKSSERKVEIIKAARRLFQTQEYDRTSMQDIMEELQIAKGTIYHYFASKDELLMAVVEDMANDNIEAMRLAISKPGTALEKMQRLVSTGQIAEDNKYIVDALHSPGNNTMHTRLLATILTKQAPLYAEVIAQGVQEGIFTTDTPLECAEFMIAGVQFLTDMGIYPWTKEDLQRRQQAFPKLIEQQLMAPKGSFQFLLNKR
ncbi:MAG: TetR/AcrR family transcriptional regulator [Chlamydiales bacterium]|nr:TetR/AcrR family transcriptional regulator [Chlamydiales bacterium]